MTLNCKNFSTTLVLITLLIVGKLGQSQQIIDSCLTSAEPGISFNASPELVSMGSDLIEWTGTEWIGGVATANITVTPINDLVGCRALFLGGNSWTTGGEGFAALLNAPLQAGETYSFDITAVSDGQSSDGTFSPQVYTNNMQILGGANLIGNLPVVGTDWTTNTFTFEATGAQDGDTWLIIHTGPTGSSGLIHSMCSDCNSNEVTCNVNLGDDTTLCNGASTTLDATTPNADYLWQDGSTDATLSTDQAGIYWVEITVGECTDIDSVTLETATVDASWTPPSDVCNTASSIDLSTLVTGTADGSWSGTGVSGNEFDPSAGTQDVTYTVTDGPCEESSTQTITVINANAEWSDPGAVCEIDGVIDLSNLITGDTGGNWSGTGITDEDTGEFDPSLAGSGSHNITYSFSGQCASSTSWEITVTSQLDATIIETDTLCMGDAPVDLSAVDSGGTWSGTGITDTDEGIFDPAVTGEGTFEITYTIDGSCGDEDTAMVTVLDVSSPISPVDPVCVNATEVTLNTETNGGLWSGNGIVNVLDGVFSPSSAGVGSHQISYTLQMNECTSNQSIEILVNPLPTVDFSPDVLDGCVPLTVTFENLGDNGICEWNFGDDQTSIECGLVQHTFEDPGVYSPSITVIDNNSCENQVQYDSLITVYQNPIADFSFSPGSVSTLKGEVQFTDESQGEINEYEWNFADMELSTLQNPEYTFNHSGWQEITLVVTDINGCESSITKQIYVEPEFHVYIPNTITIDGDGLNDVLEPVFVGVSQQNFEFRIFDRWGQVIFESTDPRNAVWLGGVDTHLVMPGIYNWQLKLQAINSKDSFEKSGVIHVIR